MTVAFKKLRDYIDKEIRFYNDGGSPKIVIVALEDVLKKLGETEKTHVALSLRELQLLFRREDRLWKESKRQIKSRFLKFLEEALGEEGIKRALLSDEK